MSRFDDRLTKELERAAGPVEPAGVFDEIDRRRERRVTVRRLQTAMLATVVFAGSIGGVLVLNRAFRGEGVTTPAISSAKNGLIVVSFGDDGGTHLYLEDPNDPTWKPSDHQLTDPIPNWGGEVHLDTNPSVSPDGRTVVFERTAIFAAGQSTSLWTIGIDGSNARQLTPSPWDAREPAWSPDGTQLAFVGSPNGQPGLYVVRTDAHNLHLLVAAGDLVVSSPSWSPDGRTLAFQATLGPDEIYEVGTIGADGGDFVAGLPDTTSDTPTQPSWSPDGVRIAFVRGRDVWTMSPTGGEQVKLTTGSDPSSTDRPGADSQPTWSPNGGWVAFERLFSPSEFFVYAIRPDGTGLHRIGLGGDPAWGAALPETPPSDPSSSSGPSSTDSPNMQVPGVSGRTCDVTSAPLSGRAVVYVYRLQQKDGCDATDPTFLAVDEGVGVVGPALPLTCADSCRIFSTPDLDGDGVQEIAVQTSEFPGVTIALYRMLVTHGPGSGLRIEPVHLVDDPSRPEAWSPAAFPWSLNPPAPAGAYCSLTGTGNRNVIIWSATVNSADPVGHYFETTYMMQDGSMQLLRGPSDRGAYPPEAFDLPSLDDLCGSPIRVSTLTTDGSPRSS